MVEAVNFALLLSMRAKAMETIERRPYSRPAFERSLNLETELAQRMVEREYPKVEYALYHVEVVLRVMGESDRADGLETLVLSLIARLEKNIRAESARFMKLREDNGILDRPVYAHPGLHKVLVASPLGHQFLSLIQTLDELMISLDALWLLGVFSNQQRANAVYQWQKNMLRLSRRLRGIPSRGNKRPDVGDNASVSDPEDDRGDSTQELDQAATQLALVNPTSDPMC